MNYRVSQNFKILDLRRKYVQKAILKIVVVLLIACFSDLGTSYIGITYAYFNDTEESLENSLRAGTLDFSLVDTGESEFEIISTGTAVRWLDVANEGSLPFQYIVRADNLSGDLCNSLTIKVILDGDIKQEGALNGFYLDPSIVFSESLDEWQFDIEFSGDPAEHENESCLFNLVYEGWQTDFGSYSASGFKDTEQAYTEITLLPEPVTDVYGCTDSFAFNYNPEATVDDGSCLDPGIGVD